MSTVLDYATWCHSRGIPIFLGCQPLTGLVMNYSLWSGQKPDIKGYMLILPQLGYTSNTTRKDNNFLSVRLLGLLSFILNYAFGP